MTFGIPGPDRDGRSSRPVLGVSHPIEASVLRIPGWRSLFALAAAVSCGPSKVAVDRSAEEAIRAEARAFYRDLLAHDTPALLNHFWPAKIAARWAPPFEPHPPRDPPLLAAAIAASPPKRCTTGDVAVSLAEVRVEGPWARAMVPRCAGESDELWLLEFAGSWKIVRLALARDR
jgi:hypothetical protein